MSTESRKPLPEMTMPEIRARFDKANQRWADMELIHKEVLNEYRGLLEEISLTGLCLFPSSDTKEVA